MRPIYKTENYYEIIFTTFNKNTEIKTTEIPVKVFTLLEAQELINQRLDADIVEPKESEVYDIKIEPKDEILDKSIILGWEDARPGDYAIHIHSRNNISDRIEVGFDFYVAKLNRDGNTIVDRYYMCWHAYQGAFLISRYLEGSDSKDTNIPVLTIYDTILCPTINEIETEIGRKWAYLKIAKYARIYAIEDPGQEQINGIEV